MALFLSLLCKMYEVVQHTLKTKNKKTRQFKASQLSILFLSREIYYQVGYMVKSIHPSIFCLILGSRGSAGAYSLFKNYKHLRFFCFVLLVLWAGRANVDGDP